MKTKFRRLSSGATSLVFLALALIFPARAAYAHAIPIYPVRIRLRVLPGQIQVEMNANSCYWEVEVFGVDGLPLDTWPEALAAKAKTYIDSHFILSADGHPLVSRLISCRFNVEPFVEFSGRHVRFSLLYDLPQDRRILAGRAFFYQNYRPELLEEARELPKDFPQTFETQLSISGRQSYRFILTLDKPEFSVSLQDARRTSWQMGWDAFVAAAQQMTGTLPFWCCIGTAVLGWPNRKLAWKGAGGVVVIFFIFGLLGRGVPGTWAPVMEWTLIVLMSLASLSRSSVEWLIGLFLNAMGWALMASPTPGWTNPLGPDWILLKACYLGGVLGCAGAVAAALVSGGLAYRRHRHQVSDVTAESIFLTESRQACIALLLFGLYRLAQSFLNR